LRDDASAFDERATRYDALSVTRVDELLDIVDDSDNDDDDDDDDDDSGDDASFRNNDDDQQQTGARYTTHTRTASSASLTIDLADLIELFVTPLLPHVVDDWLATLCATTPSVDSTLDSMQLGAVADALGSAKPAPPHAQLDVRLGVLGLHLSVAQCVPTATSTPTTTGSSSINNNAMQSTTRSLPLMSELLVERVRLELRVCRRSATLPIDAPLPPAVACGMAWPHAFERAERRAPRELCHVGVDATIGGAYVLARRVTSRERLPPTPMLASLLERLRDDNDNDDNNATSFVGDRMTLQQLSADDRCHAPLLVVALDRVAATLKLDGPGHRQQQQRQSDDGGGRATLLLKRAVDVRCATQAGAPLFGAVRQWLAASESCVTRVGVLSELGRLRRAAIVEALLLGRIAAWRRQRASIEPPPPEFDFRSLWLLRAEHDAALDAAEEHAAAVGNVAIGNIAIGHSDDGLAPRAPLTPAIVIAARHHLVQLVHHALYRHRLDAIAAARRFAAADVARLREALARMPPRRRAALDARLARPAGLLVESLDTVHTTAVPLSPRAQDDDAATDADAQRRESLASDADAVLAHNNRVVSRCVARYRDLVGSCNDRAPEPLRSVVQVCSIVICVCVFFMYVCFDNTL
jgi:hypothetical protein